MSNESETLHLLSPSLTSCAQGATAFEVKFLIDEGQAADVTAWAVRHLDLDPHCKDDSSGQYKITSLYTDTENFDVFHRQPKYRRRKYRLRRYGEESTIHLERKVRKGNQVAKRRTSVTEDEMSLLTNPLLLSDWSANWFHDCLLRKQLRPVCQLVYHRHAFLAHSSEGLLRLTMDRNIQGEPCSEWKVGMTGNAESLVPGKVVLELKFRDAMPVIFKRLVADMQLSAVGFSKYRHCINLFSTNLLPMQPEVKYA